MESGNSTRHCAAHGLSSEQRPTYTTGIEQDAVRAMSQSEAQAFLSAFAAVTTAPPPALQRETPSQRKARKLRPVKLKSEQADNPAGLPSPFAATQTEPHVVSPLPRQLPQQIHTGNNASDPFLRPVSRKLEPRAEPHGAHSAKQTPPKPKRRPRRFVPLSQFEAIEKESDVHAPSEIKSKRSHVLSPPNHVWNSSSLPLNSETRERVTRHVSHLRAVSSNPNDFIPAMKALISCFHSSSTGEPVSLWPTCRPFLATSYCREVLRQAIPLVMGYPAPVTNAFREAFSDLGLPAPDSSFPATTVAWTPCLGGSSTFLHVLDAEPESVSRRLQGNLETTWDQILRLQRMYRGDISSCPPGTLDVNVALRAMAMLHPANMDVFAARLLQLVSDTRLHSRDKQTHMRRLGERLRDAPPRKHGVKGPGVVLHRLPELVRLVFEDDPAHLFFLDFLTGVDSAKLNTALIPRLVAAIAKALEAAASATTNVAFTDAVLDARIYAKLLSVTMHSSNWAHSAFSLSGMDDNQVSPGLGILALQRRVPIQSALFTAAIDLETLLRDAIASEHVLPVIASVAVADVIIRLAAVDPVAKASKWYKRGVDVLRSVRVISSGTGESMPLLRTVVCSVLESDACKEEGPLEMADPSLALECDRQDWPGIGDTRLLRAVCPLLDDLRKSAHMHDTGSKPTVRRIRPQAAPNAESTILKKGGTEAARVSEIKDSIQRGDVQAALRREFYARMDGRLRELVRVVVSSRPENRKIAKEKYLKIVEMLYPDTTKTVAAVAANLCEFEVGVLERELGTGDRGDRDNPEAGGDGGGIQTAGEGIREMTV